MPFVAPKLLESARVCVRPVAESDLPSLLAINGDEEVVRFLGHAPWQAMTDAKAWFERISKLQASGSALEFVIVERQTGSVIGRCGLFDFEEVNAHAALGYILGRAHWGQGYMREALTALIHSAFSEMGLRRLEAKVEAKNTASAALLQHLGFSREGVLRERWISKGEIMDAEVYGLLRHEWSHFPGAAIGRTSTVAELVVAKGRSNSTSPMRLIRYQPEYQELMLALHRSAIEGFGLGMSQQQDEADLTAIEDVYLHSHGEFLLGLIDERLVAMGGFKWLSDGVAELRRMRIAQELQGQGYGTILLRELERRAFQSGIRMLGLETALSRPLTLQFYRRHGYQETGHSFYGAVETVQFSKQLDERACVT